MELGRPSGSWLGGVTVGIWEVQPVVDWEVFLRNLGGTAVDVWEISGRLRIWEGKYVIGWGMIEKLFIQNKKIQKNLISCAFF